MSLTIYTDKSKIPNDLLLISENDAFFDGATILKDDAITRYILKTIDQATYVNEYMFSGRAKCFGNLDKSNLSTGAKTLLNIAQHADKCFDVVECGNNALCVLPYLRDGYVYWKNIYAVYAGDGACDILWNDKHYTDFYDLMDVWRVYDE